MSVPVRRQGMLEVRRKRVACTRQLTVATSWHLSDIITNTTGTVAFNNIHMVVRLEIVGAVFC